MTLHNSALIVSRWLLPGLYQAIRIKEADDIELAKMRADALRHIPPNETGRLGVAYIDGHFRDLDSLAVYTMIKNKEIDPILMRLDKMERMLLAAGGHVPENITEQITTQNMPQLPTRVPLTGLLDKPPSFRDVILGVAATEHGNEIVRADMADLVHIAVGGSSGWGKSFFLRSLAYQLARSIDPVDLVMVDLEGATLAPFTDCDRLLYPVVDTEKDARYIFSELSSELDKRKELFSTHRGIDSLYAYNAVADEKMPPLVAIIDEATALLEDRECEKQIGTLSLRARKYGMWLVLAGQDWKAASLDTRIRNQLASRIQFRAMSKGQSRILLERSDAESLNIKGRAFAWLPGRDFVEFQAPMISHQDIMAAMSGGPQNEIVTDLMTQAERIRELHDIGISNRQIALDIFGYEGGAAFHKIKEALGNTAVVGCDSGNTGEEMTRPVL